MYLHFLLKYPIQQQSSGLIGKITSAVWDSSKYIHSKVYFILLELLNSFIILEE